MRAITTSTTTALHHVDVGPGATPTSDRPQYRHVGAGRFLPVNEAAHVERPAEWGAVPGDRQLPGSSSAVTAGSASWSRAVWKMPKFPVIQRAVSLTLAIRHPLEVRSNRFV